MQMYKELNGQFVSQTKFGKMLGRTTKPFILQLDIERLKISELTKFWLRNFCKTENIALRSLQNWYIT